MKRMIKFLIIGFILLAGSYLAWATVSSQTTKVFFTCNGSTTTFSCTGGNKIPCFASTDIEVRVRTDSTGVDELLTLTTDYSVSALNNNYTNGFTVTTVATYSSGKTLVVKRSIGLTQEVNLIRGRAIPAESMEKTLDRQVLALQDSVEELRRALRIPVTDSSYDMNLPSSVERKGRYLGFSSATGDPVLTAGTSEITTHSSFGESLADDADAAAALTTLGLSAYVQTLVDDANSAEFQSTLNISSYAQTIFDDANSTEARITLGVIPANNTYLVAVDAAGTGTVDLIKADSNDVAVVPDNSQTATNAAPTQSKALANKKYVDDQIAIATNPTGDSPTVNDSESNAMLKAHAYKAQTAGFVTGWCEVKTASYLLAYVGDTSDPVGAGAMIGHTGYDSAGDGRPFLGFFVGKDKYFELIHSTQTVIITWTPLISGGGAPIDQD